MSPAKKTKKKTATKKKTTKKKATRKKKKAVEEPIEFKPPESAAGYSMSSAFEKEQWLDHPKFGMGMVEEILNEKKIRVRFENDTVILVQNFSS